MREQAFCELWRKTVFLVAKCVTEGLYYHPSQSSVESVARPFHIMGTGSTKYLNEHAEQLLNKKQRVNRGYFACLFKKKNKQKKHLYLLFLML